MHGRSGSAHTCQICKTRVAFREKTSAHEQALRKATCTHEFLVARCEHARCQVMCRSRPTEACRALGPAVMLCDVHEHAYRGHVCATTWPGNRAHSTDALGGLHSCPISHSACNDLKRAFSLRSLHAMQVMESSRVTARMCSTCAAQLSQCYAPP